MSTRKPAAEKPAAEKAPQQEIERRPADAWADTVDPVLLAGAIVWKGWGDEALTEDEVRDAVEAFADREVGS